MLICFSFICFDEFKRFEEILCMPDVLFKCAFHLFDTTGSGFVGFGRKSFYKNFCINLFICPKFVRKFQGNNQSHSGESNDTVRFRMRVYKQPVWPGQEASDQL